MSALSLVSKLKLLLEIKNEQNQVNQTINKLNQQVTVQKVQIEKLQRLHAHEEANLLQAKKDVDLCQLEVETVRVEETTRRQQLEKERHGETIRTLSATVGRLERTRINAENELETLWREMEKTQNQLKQIQEQATIRTQELKEKIEHLLTDVAAQKNKLPQIDAQMLSILDTLPNEIKEQILSMEKSSVQIPIAPVIQSLCSACFYPISSRGLGILAQKNAENIITCQSCFTILYSEPAPTSDEVSEK
jgi:predicted  nucleic acid-binding Zn-ribbon protein